MQANLYGRRSGGHGTVDGNADLAVSGGFFGGGVGVRQAQGSGKQNHGGAKNGKDLPSRQTRLPTPRTKTCPREPRLRRHSGSKLRCRSRWSRAGAGC